MRNVIVSIRMVGCHFGIYFSRNDRLAAIPSTRYVSCFPCRVVPEHACASVISRPAEVVVVAFVVIIVMRMKRLNGLQHETSNMNR